MIRRIETSTIVLVFCLVMLEWEVSFSTQNIAIFPFKDKSGFRGDWELEKEIPALLGKVLAENPLCVIIPPDSVVKALNKRKLKMDDPDLLAEIGEEVGADAVITGVIRDFNLSRFAVGDPMLGGYKSYSASVKLEKVRLLRVIDGREIGVIEAEENVTDRDLGLDLFGRPRRQDYEFFNLEEMEFGSKRFRETVMGRATFGVLEELGGKIETFVILPSLKIPPGQTVMILSVDGDEAYINLGNRDGVVVGYKFDIYRVAERSQGMDEDNESYLKEERVGVVQVTAVVGAHLSKVRMLEGAGRIKPGDLVRVGE